MVSETPGGKRLRVLREFYGKTQLDIELDASLGIGYLQRLERGRVKQPEHDTLERILSALDARFTERREVLEMFGYVVSAPLPTESDVAWAISVCQEELDGAMFPAYLLDCGHRLVYCNKSTDYLFDTSIAHGLSMLKMVFDAQYQMTDRIKNSEIFFPAQIRALRYEMQRFQDEAWCTNLIDEMLTCDVFADEWHRGKEGAVHIPARPLTPLELEIDNEVMRFRLISEPFVQDHRFRVIFYLPADGATTQACLNWAAEKAS